jgi:hypothetical protein
MHVVRYAPGTVVALARYEPASGDSQTVQVGQGTV